MSQYGSDDDDEYDNSLKALSFTLFLCLSSYVTIKSSKLLNNRVKKGFFYIITKSFIM